MNRSGERIQPSGSSAGVRGRVPRRERRLRLLRERRETRQRPCGTGGTEIQCGSRLIDGFFFHFTW